MKLLLAILTWISGFIVLIFLLYDSPAIIQQSISVYFSIDEDSFIRSIIEYLLCLIIFIAAAPAMGMCFLATNAPSFSESEFRVSVFLIVWAIVGFLAMVMLEKSPTLRVLINVFFVLVSYYLLIDFIDSDKKKS
jgi:hypothetical protein